MAEETSTQKQPPAFIAFVQRVVAWVMRLKPVRVLTEYGQRRGPLLASGLSNQALFAVFAALWVGVSVFGIIVSNTPRLQEALFEIISETVPGLIDQGDGGAVRPSDLVNTTVLGWTGAIALAGLVFTAIGWLSSARDAIRMMADLPAPTTNFLLLKLKDLGLAIGFGLLLVISAALSVLSSELLGTVLDLLGIRDSTASTLAGRALSTGIMFLFDAVVLAALYRVLAGVPIPFRHLAPGALLGAAALGALKFLGTSLLGGATNNPLLASFAVIAGLLIWFTLVCQVILIAACWVFVGMRDANLPLDSTEAARLAREAALERMALKEELRAEIAAEGRRSLWQRIFGRRAR
ncbi:YihY/virulence factor BrkB family protein [Salinibacterium sp. ZJ77]|uniref:YihY/virulence factor BrkB family protein n=1 Tax=Salinibacterium sp. ZJ77 TaxID=2708337 RepID=UPI00141D8AC9|nr:YihY/virulence factor BrkB family protein [Salinibacterium sp. ZJ77]